MIPSNTNSVLVRPPFAATKRDLLLLVNWQWLAGVFLALSLFATLAYPQTILTLGSNPTRTRAEGMTEVVGLLTLSNNTNAVQVIPGGSTITVTYDGTITNDPGVATVNTTAGTLPDRNIYTTGTGSSRADGGGTNGMTVFRSGAVLTLTIPANFTNTGSGACAPGTSPATATTFCLIPGGSLNIQGVRVNVTGVSGNFNATINSSAIAFPGGANSTVVGRAQATIGSVSVPTPVALSQCAFPPTPTVIPGPATGAQLAGGFAVNVTEPSSFPAAFSAASSSGGPFFWDEAGITPTGFQGTAPVPTRGVQIVLSFSGLSAGMVLLAPQAFNGPGLSLGLVVGGGVPGTSVTTYSAFPSSGGQAVITYEFVTMGFGAPTTVDTLSIPVYYTTPLGTLIPAGSAGTVQASVGPVSSTTGFSTTAAQLRFASNSGVPVTPLQTGTVSSCTPAGSITATAGTPQSTTVNTPFATALQALVKDTSGNPLPGATVTFSAPASGASGRFGGATSVFVTTDSNGLATAPISANTVAGSYTATAFVSGVIAATYSLTNTAGPPAIITATAGSVQSAFPGVAFSTPLQATVRDSFNNLRSGVAVIFEAPSFGASGTFAGSLQATATTNASGVATAPTFTANELPGQYSVTATTPNSISAFFNLTNLFGSPASLALGSSAAKVRREGITEAVGTITLTNNTGSAQVIPAGSSITITYDGAITNDPGIATTAVGAIPDRNIYTTGLGSSQQDGGGGISQYLFGGGCTLSPPSFPCQGLVVARSGAALTVTVPNSFMNLGTGACAAFTPPATFNGFCLVPGGSLNIAGVRVRASGLIGNVYATVTSGAISFSGGNWAVVATAQPTIGAVSVVAPAALSQCAIPVTPTTLPGPATAAQLAGGFYVNVAEPAAFPTAFNAASSRLTPFPWDERGITPGGIGSSNTSGATAVALGFQGTAQQIAKGTQIVLNLSGLPAGIVLLAPQGVTTGGSVSTTTGLATTGQIFIGLVMGVVSGGPVGTYSAITPIGGSATITYLVIETGSESPVTVDTLSIPIYYTAPAGTVVPVGLAGTVQASVGPVSATTSFSTTATQLRFTTNSGVPVTPLQTGTVNACIGPPASITVTGGSGQSTAVNASFLTPIQATVRDGSGNPVPGASVTFSTPTSGASGTFFGPSAQATVFTNPSGVALAPPFTANTIAGSYMMTASVLGVSTPVSFSLTNNAGPAASITATAGNSQSATVNTAFTTALQATVKDSFANLVSGATVTFAAPASGASGTFASAGTATTNASGVATAPAFTANTTAGAYTVTATAGAASASFSLTNNAGSASVITATAGDGQSATVNTAFTTALQATVKDSFNNPISGATVTFAAPASGASGVFASAGTATTNSSGMATAPAFTANTTSGAYTVTATAGAFSATFSMTNNAGAASAITATAGSGQSATVNTVFVTALQATVKDSFGNPVSGATVTFAAPASGPSGSFASPGTATTNSSGVATAPALTANTTAGSYTATATAGSASASFSLTNRPGSAANITAAVGGGQSATVSTAFATALQAIVKDSFGNPVSGVLVTFTGPASEPRAMFSAGNSVTTNAGGVAAVAVTAGTQAGTYTVTAGTAGVAGTATFSLTNNAAPAASAPSISIASGNNQRGRPGAHLTVGVSVNNDHGSVAGAPVTFSVIQGDATVSPTAVTTSSGTALADVTLGTRTGPVTVQASLSDGSSVTFSLFLDGPAAISAISSTSLSGMIGANLPVVVKVTDATGNPLAGITVTFFTASPLATLSATSAMTNIAGQAQITATLGSQPGTTSIIASAPGLTQTVTFTLQISASALQPRLSILPNSVTVDAVSGGSNPGPVTMVVSNGGSGVIPWSVEAGLPVWLSVTPGSGSTPAALVLNFDTSTLAPGAHQTQVTVVSGNMRQSVSVQLNLAARRDPGFLVQPAHLNFVAASNVALSDTDAVRTVQVVNPGSGPVSWTAEVGSAAWLSITPASGTAPAQVQVRANPSGLAAGAYFGSIRFQATGGGRTFAAQVNVILQVGAFQPRLLLSPRVLAYHGPVGGTLPSRTVEARTDPVTNPAFTVGDSSTPSWLGLSPSSGILPASIIASVNSTGLSGTSTAAVPIKLNNGVADSLTVVVNLVKPADRPQLLLSEGGLLLVAKAGGATVSKPVQLQAHNGASFAWSAVGSTSSGGNWLNVSPPTGSGAGTLTVTASPAGLAAGIYHGEVALISSDTMPPSQLMAVTLLVTPAQESESAASSTAVATGILLATSPVGQFMATYTVPQVLRAALVDASGQPISGAEVRVAFSTGDPAVTLKEAGAGIYEGAWAPLITGDVVLTFSSGAATGSDFRSGSVLASGPSLPVLFRGGAVNAASFSAGQALAPGAIASLFGRNLGSETAGASLLPLPLTLAGASLSINGLAAPLFYVSPGQINFQVPLELAGQTAVTLRLTSGGQTVMLESVPLAPLAPGIFTANGTQGAIIHQDGSLADSVVPATAGEVLSIYATGLGETTALPATGTAAGASPLSEMRTLPVVTIGGIPAEVGFSGLAPGAVGLYQVNVKVPAGVSATATPVVVSVNGMVSNTVTIAVK